MTTENKPSEDLVNVDRAFNNAWLVYLNGIEVPVVGVSVSYGVWQIPQAEITLVPEASMQRLGAEDRLSVQIFYLDHWHDPDNKEFRLLFDGEIVAWSYVNVQRGRSISFTCLDYIQIFNQLFFFFMSNIDDIATGVADSSVGVGIDGVRTAGMGTLYPYSLFAEGLINSAAPTPNDADPTTSNAPSVPLIKRPIEYVYNVVKGLIQANVPNRSVPAANFFAPWARRTKFHRRFLAIPFLEDSDNPGIFPIIRAVQSDFAVTAVSQIAQNIGSRGSIWAMLQEIYKTLMMEIVMLPTASLLKSDYATLNIKGAPKDSDKTQGLQPLMLGNYFTKPELLFSLPPACNVVFPPMVRHFSYQEDYSTQPTRMTVNGEAWTELLSAPQTIRPGLLAHLRAATAVAHPEELNFALRNTVARPGENAQNVLIYPEEFYKGPVVARRQTPRWFSYLNFAQGQSPQTPSNPREVVAGDEASDIYRKYAAYEYHKERYQRRQGGMVLNFNPYIVPGFPCAVFDRRSTQIDVFGYVMSVRQTMNTRDATTQVSFSHGRTMSEMFELLSRQFEMENKIIDIEKRNEDAPREDSTATTGNRTVSKSVPGTIERVGPIAMGPAEPLVEVRDQLQHFDRAEQFYRALFFREPTVESRKVADSEAEGTLDTRPQDPATEQERVIARTIAGNALSSNPITAPTVTDVGTSFKEEFTIPQFLKRSVKESTTNAQINKDLRNGKTASFQYYRLIDFVDAAGLRSGVRIRGIDQKTRQTFKEIISRIKTNSASIQEINTVAGTLGVETITYTDLLADQISPLAEIDEDVNINQILAATGQSSLLFQQTRDALLKRLEKRLNETPIDSNLSGSVGIVPKQTAAALFESYEAAMTYASRPICTLDEYIKFLGSDGVRGRAVEPLAALGPNDPRTFAAKYYGRIRQYVNGPPTVALSTNIVNSPFITTPDGFNKITVEGGETDPETLDPVVNAPPEGFPQTRANWDDIILAYNINALERLAPST